MLSERKTWPARTVAAAMTLALLLASMLAVCEHAAGHQRAASGAVHGGLAHSFHTPDAGSGPEQLLAAEAHEDGAPDESGCGSGSCNFMCAGGCAILVAAAVMDREPPAVPATEPAFLVAGEELGGPERPPKASLPA
jgi:hypothetical protein